MSEKQGPVVLVVGVLHHDLHLHVTALPKAGQHLSGGPWAPGLGGKGGLQAVAAAKAGRARMLGAIGSDAFGGILRDGLRLAGVEDQFLQRREAAGTGLQISMELPDGQAAVVSVAGANLTLDVQGLEEPELWNWVGLVLLQNEVLGEVNLAAAMAGRRHGAPVMLNAGPGRALEPAFLDNVTHMVIEGGDLGVLGGAPVGSLEEAALAAKDVMPHLVGLVVLLGSDGLAARDRGRVFTLPGDKVRPGASDSFCGTLAAALARGLPLEPACLLARKAMGRGA